MRCPIPSAARDYKDKMSASKRRAHLATAPQVDAGDSTPSLPALAGRVPAARRAATTKSGAVKSARKHPAPPQGLAGPVSRRATQPLNSKRLAFLCVYGKTRANKINYETTDNSHSHLRCGHLYLGGRTTGSRLQRYTADSRNQMAHPRWRSPTTAGRHAGKNIQRHGAGAFRRNGPFRRQGFFALGRREGRSAMEARERLHGNDTYRRDP